MRGRFILSLSIMMAIAPFSVARGQTRVWRQMGQSLVVMISGRTGQVWTMLTPNQPAKGYTFLAGFAFSRSTTHFYMQTDGKQFPIIPLK